jgi:hypothetical protein
MIFADGEMDDVRDASMDYGVHTLKHGATCAPWPTVKLISAWGIELAHSPGIRVGRCRSLKENFSATVKT